MTPSHLRTLPDARPYWLVRYAFGYLVTPDFPNWSRWASSQREATRFDDRHDAYVARDAQRKVMSTPSSVRVVRVYPREVSQ